MLVVGENIPLGITKLTTYGGAFISSDTILADGSRIVVLENCRPGEGYSFTIPIEVNATLEYNPVKTDYKKHNDANIRKPVRSKKGRY